MDVLPEILTNKRVHFVASATSVYLSFVSIPLEFLDMKGSHSNPFLGLSLALDSGV
jgi:hypothetical protein